MTINDPKPPVPTGTPFVGSQLAEGLRAALAGSEKWHRLVGTQREAMSWADQIYFVGMTAADVRSVIAWIDDADNDDAPPVCLASLIKDHIGVDLARQP